MDEVLKKLKIISNNLIVKSNNSEYNIVIRSNIPFIENYDVEYSVIPHFCEWPGVYIIYNNNARIAYVGQTKDIKNRIITHFKDESKREFKENRNTKVLFFDIKEANLSICMQLEHLLIEYMNVDKKFKLLNGNAGMRRCRYYNDSSFENAFEKIWYKLKEMNFVNSKYETIRDDASLRYSPYLALNNEQFSVVSDVIKELTINNRKAVVVEGSAGTGKTAIAIHLLKLLIDYSKNINSTIDDYMIGESIDDIYKINTFFKSNKNLKIGIVFPMKNFCNTIRSNIKKIINIKASEFVFQPNEIADYYNKTKKKFDILIIDEAQRLSTSNFATSNQSNNAYNERQRKLKIPQNDYNCQLEWFDKISKKQIFFYDVSQRISKGDIDYEYFRSKWLKDNAVFKKLTIQERCIEGGEEYINLLKDIFNSKTIFDDKTINDLKNRIAHIDKYEFLNYIDIFKMTNKVKKLYDENKGGCFTLSGYSWKNTKLKDFIKNNDLKNKYGEFSLDNYDKYLDEFVKHDMHNIEIGQYKNIWNYSDNWFDSPTARNEVGCIHVTAGLDIEYAGVIIGKDLTLGEDKKLKCNKKEFHDANTKRNATEEELLEFILDSYYILFTRGRRGTFVYADDPQIQALLKELMKTVD